MITINNQVKNETKEFSGLKVGATFDCNDGIYIKLNDNDHNNCFCLSTSNICYLMTTMNVIEVDLLISVVRKDGT